METRIDNILKNVLNEKNVIYLIGAGASTPYFSSLGNFETLMTDSSLSDESKNLVRIQFFKQSVSKNVDLLKYLYEKESLIDQEKKDVEKISNEYTRFIHSNIEYLKTRNSRISPRRMSVVTTNYDLFFEVAMDNLLRDNTRLFFNDGMNGYALRKFDIDNFNKSLSYTGVFDEYSQEMPVINFIKCHGSANWIEREENGNKYLSSMPSVDLLIKINNKITELEPLVNFSTYCITNTEHDLFKKIIDDIHINNNVDLLNEISSEYSEQINTIIKLMEKIQLIYPTKQKFETTLINQNYYSMLRYLSYELEKEETVLIAFGFSFYDEHITDIVKRSLNNPRLLVIIFCYEEGKAEEIMQTFKLTKNTQPANLIFVTPDNFLLNTILKNSVDDNNTLVGKNIFEDEDTIYEYADFVNGVESPLLDFDSLNSILETNIPKPYIIDTGRTGVDDEIDEEISEAVVESE